MIAPVMVGVLYNYIVNVWQAMIQLFLPLHCSDWFCLNGDNKMILNSLAFLLLVLVILFKSKITIIGWSKTVLTSHVNLIMLHQNNDFLYF